MLLILFLLFYFLSFCILDLYLFWQSLNFQQLLYCHLCCERYCAFIVFGHTFRIDPTESTINISRIMWSFRIDFFKNLIDFPSHCAKCLTSFRPSHYSFDVEILPRLNLPSIVSKQIKVIKSTSTRLKVVNLMAKFEKK